jgi:hypothetical protein
MSTDEMLHFVDTQSQSLQTWLGCFFPTLETKNEHANESITLISSVDSVVADEDCQGFVSDRIDLGSGNEARDIESFLPWRLGIHDTFANDIK